MVNDDEYLLFGRFKYYDGRIKWLRMTWLKIEKDGGGVASLSLEGQESGHNVGRCANKVN